MRGGVGTAIAVAAIAVLVLLLYGVGFVGYDTGYALIWGRDLIEGRVPDYEIRGAPTPHPLATAVAALASALGDGAVPALAVVWAVCFAALGVAAFKLGDELFSAPVGVVFAALVLTRDIFVDGVHQALAEVPFLALVMWALVLEARQSRRGSPVLVLLALAGLLRPEGWLLAGAYFAYLLPALDRPGRLRALALTLAAPLVWALTDLLVTGDPLHSLHHTQSGAERLARPREVDVALRAVPEYLEDILQAPVVWAGLAGCAAAIYLLYERALLPAAVLGIGLLGFLVLGVAEVPLLPRYYYVPASMLALFCGVAVFGWLNLPRGSAARRVWMAAGGVIAVALIASAPEQRRVLTEVHAVARERKRLDEELRDFVRRPETWAWVESCQPLHVVDGRMVPVLIYSLDSQSRIPVIRPSDPRLGTFVGPPPGDNRAYAVDSRIPIPYPVPAAYQRVEESRRWALYRGC
jgi:hypothetical protein